MHSDERVVYHLLGGRDVTHQHGGQAHQRLVVQCVQVGEGRVAILSQLGGHGLERDREGVGACRHRGGETLVGLMGVGRGVLLEQVLEPAQAGLGIVAGGVPRPPECQ